MLKFILFLNFYNIALATYYKHKKNKEETRNKIGTDSQGGLVQEK